MKPLIGRIIAVEEQERTDKQRQVRDDAHVGRAVLLQMLGIDIEVLREVEIHGHSAYVETERW